jgi:hypothetical protein
MTDSAEDTFEGVHANSVCAVVSSLYFNGFYTEEELIAELQDYYWLVLKMACYESFPESL